MEKKNQKQKNDVRLAPRNDFGKVLAALVEATLSSREYIESVSEPSRRKKNEKNKQSKKTRPLPQGRSPQFTMEVFQECIGQFTRYNAHRGGRSKPALLINFEVWNDIIGDSKDFPRHFEPAAEGFGTASLHTGHLGYIAHVPLFTDGFEERQLTRSGEYYVVPASKVLGLLASPNRKYFLRALGNLKTKVVGLIPR